MQQIGSSDIDQRDLLIAHAVEAAMEKYPNLEEFDNPHERIAEFFESELFPGIAGESSVEWEQRTGLIIDEIWGQVAQRRRHLHLLKCKGERHGTDIIDRREWTLVR